MYHKFLILFDWANVKGKTGKTLALPKVLLNQECIDEVIVSPKMPTKNLKDFSPGSLLECNKYGNAFTDLIFKIQELLPYLTDKDRGTFFLVIFW